MKLNKTWKKTAIVFVSIIGVISSIISLLTISLNSLNLYLGVVIIFLTCVIVIVIAFILPKDNIPEEMDTISEIIENSSLKERIRIVFPCDSRYFKAANKLAKDKFGKNSVSRRTVTDWKLKNGLILSCLSDNNKMVGYFDILPLDNEFAYKLIKGEVGENDIKGKHILPVHKMKEAEYIYFAGIAVQNPESVLGLFHATYLVCAAVLYVNYFYSKGVLKKVLTIPTSDCGLKMARHLNFSLETESKLRTDGNDLYSWTFQVHEIIKLIENKKIIYDRFDATAYSIQIETI